MRRLRAETPFLLELLAATGVAIAQPVLDVLAQSPETIILHQASGTAIVLAAMAIVFAPPLVLWGVELLAARASERLRLWLHMALLGLMAGVIALQVTKHSTSVGRGLLVVVGVAAALVGVSISRIRIVRLWLRYLALAPLAFLVLFVATPPMSSLLAQHSGASPHVTVRRPAPIVMVVFDEFPLMSLLDGQGHVDGDLYPNLAALADTSTWFRNDTTVSSMTASAVPAILTGRYPLRFGTAPAVAEYPENLFTLLGERYDVHASEKGTSLCPGRVCHRAEGGATEAVGPILRDGLKVFRWRTEPERSLLPLALGVDNLEENDAPLRVQAFLESIAKSDRPTLDYIHFMLPHSPWQYLPSGRRYDAPNPPEGSVFFRWGDDASAAAARQRHLLQVAYCDKIVGQVVARMKELGTYDKSLLIVTADHGVAFKARSGIRGVYPDNYEQILWTPLFVKTPGQPGGAVSDRQVRSIDLLPTIADVIGVDVPWELDGISVFRPRSERETLRVLGWTRWDTVQPGPDGFMRLDARRFRTVLESSVPRGEGPGDLARYQTGRLGSLVGRRVDALPRGSPSPALVRFTAPEQWADVNPRAETVPTYVSGTITAGHRVAVAVSVDGVIGGWSETLLTSEGSDVRKFFTVIPPALLRAGRNEIRVYVAKGDVDNAVTLSPVRAVAP